MKTGFPISLPRGKIDYQQLREINPETARRAVLEYLKTRDHNISEAASMFGINRSVVDDIIKKEKGSNLKDRPKVPKQQPGKTPKIIKVIEDRAIEAKSRTRLKRERLSRYHNRLAYLATWCPTSPLSS